MIWGPQTGDLDDDQVLAAYPWPDADGERWVRAMMVTTLDGAAAGPDGLSGSISGAADEAVFSAVRRLADAVLVGAGTLRSERYGPMVADPADAAARAASGQGSAPTLVFVSGTLDLPWTDPVFSDSTHTPIVMTSEEVSAEALAVAHQHSEVVQLPGEVEPAQILAELERRGLRRIVCEGGPSLLESLVAQNLLDEADITVSPTFAGTAMTPRTSGLVEVAQFELQHVLTRDGFVMLRYTRPAAGAAQGQA